MLSAGQQCSAPAEAEEDEDLQLRLRLREAFSELLDDPAALLADVRPCGPPDSRLARASQTLAAPTHSAARALNRASRPRTSITAG